MKVWTSNTLKGAWTIGVAVVVADTIEDAVEFMNKALDKDDYVRPATAENLVELPLVVGTAVILFDGNY